MMRWAWRSIYGGLCAFSLLVRLFATASELPDLSFAGVGNRSDGLPYFLGGAPLDLREYVSNAEVPAAPYSAQGRGLRVASTGRPSSFTIRIEGENSTASQGGWDVDGKHFVYVSIVSTDHAFSAVVESNGDGTLKATYTSRFPGDYLVFIQEVDMREPFERDGLKSSRPIRGSPFSLTIAGDPTVNIGDLPTCGTEEDLDDISSTFWRTGSWVTSKYASAEHGVLRDGWVFQPHDCVHDAFDHSALMLLAAMEEPTWLLVAGNSIQRGVFQTLVDMVLATGQKDNFHTSVIKKCWGIADVQLGSLRLTYQDLRLYDIGQATEDSVVCNDDKLACNSTTEYISASERLFRETVFKENEPWPNAIMAPSHMVDTDEATNPQINALLAALPDSWNGSLIMMEHMAGLRYFFDYENPTALSLAKAKPKYKPQEAASADGGLGKMGRFRIEEPRLTFMSAFPMYQSRFFDGEMSRRGQPCYGCSPHYHYVSSSSRSPEAWHGAKMVQSDVTEMLANVFISKVVGTKAALYRKAASLHATSEPKPDEQTQFQVCSDCPAGLIPFHIKPVPDLTCNKQSFLAGNAAMGAAWGGKRCPFWCQKENIDFVSNNKGVRLCPLQDPHRRR